MKPQAMGSQEFFLALCRELGLSPTDSDEETVIAAVKAKVDRLQNEVNQHAQTKKDLRDIGAWLNRAEKTIEEMRKIAR